MSFELDDDEDEDVVRGLLEIADRHGMQLASMLTFAHPDRETGDGQRLGVARLLGAERPEVVDAIWATCRRVRRVLRNGPAQPTPGTPGARPDSTNRGAPSFRPRGRSRRALRPRRRRPLHRFLTPRWHAAGLDRSAGSLRW